MRADGIPSAPPWEGQRLAETRETSLERDDMKKALIGCLCVAAVVVAALALGTWLWLFRELPVLSATLAVPSEAKLDGTVVMVVTTTNAHEKAVTLDSVDIDDAFLDGFQVVKVEPTPTDTMHILGQRSWSFDQAVEPGGTLEVRFELKAVQEGHFSGDVDVCNPNQDFTTLVADVVVRK
jgi:hypothetical protein